MITVPESCIRLCKQHELSSAVSVITTITTALTKIHIKGSSMAGRIRCDCYRCASTEQRIVFLIPIGEQTTLTIFNGLIRNVVYIIEGRFLQVNCLEVCVSNSSSVVFLFYMPLGQGLSRLHWSKDEISIAFSCGRFGWTEMWQNNPLKKFILGNQ